MSKSGKPNIGAVMVRVHNAITRGLDVSSERSATFVREGYPDAATQEGLVTYVRTLASVLNAHHLSEDHVAFPYLRSKLPDAPYDELLAEHREMEEILEELQVAVEAVAAQAQAGDSLNALNGTVTRLAELWHPHIDKEQFYLYDIEKTEAVMDLDEQIQLSRELGEYSQQQGDPALMVPFLFYNLPPEERAEMAQAAPPALLQELLPVVWKEKWAPMEPFLLD
jgi:hemerythrin-like domain-containing protein